MKQQQGTLRDLFGGTGISKQLIQQMKLLQIFEQRSLYHI